MENVKRNFIAFVWHGFWLALAQTFAERNTILPALVLKVGGTKTTLGILTSVVIGVPLLAQLIFAGYLNTKPRKKKFLILGILLRVSAFAGLSFTVFYSNHSSSEIILTFIFILMLIFSVSGAFAGVSYTDIVGKSMDTPTRKKFLVVRQFIGGIGLLISALTARQLLKSFDYPNNYALLFGIAAILLFIASFGFMAIKEKPSEIEQRHNSIFDILRSVPGILKKDTNFRTFIIIVNLTGFALTIIPFYIALGKTAYEIGERQVGNLLLIQITGMILSNIFWSKFVHTKGYKNVLKTFIFLQIILPILFLLVTNHLSFLHYNILFFIVGLSISAQKISIEGILYEITTEANRALYSGVYGALSLTISLFPLISGLLLNLLGYSPILLGVSFIVLLSTLFVKKLSISV